MLRWLTNHAGVSAGNRNDQSFADLDTALTTLLGHAPAVSYHTQTQVQTLDRIQAMCASVNATCFMGPDGKITVSRAISAAAPAFTINRRGGSPRATDWRSLDTPEPWWRLKAQAARTYRVHNLNEIDYLDDLIDRGDFNPAEKYRQGHIVRLPSDGKRYLYIHPTPTSNSPPNPTYWALYEDVVDATVVKYADGVPIEDLKPAEPGSDVTGSHTAAAILGQGPWATLQRDVNSTLAQIDQIGGDGVLAGNEKRQLKRSVDRIVREYTDLVARATALGVSTAALTTAYNSFFALLNGYSPSYLDFRSSTTIYVPAFGTDTFPTGWTATGGAIASQALPWTNLSDPSAAAQAGLTRTKASSGAVAKQYSVIFSVAKDAIPKATRFAVIRAQVGGTRTFDLAFDTLTGEVTSPGANAADAFGKHDMGAEWGFWFTFTSPAASNEVILAIYPAFGNGNLVSGNYSVARTGSINIGNYAFAEGGVTNLGAMELGGRLADFSTQIVALLRAVMEKGSDINGGLVDGGSVNPTLPLSRLDLRTILGTAAGILGQGFLATRNLIRSANLMPDGSFEQGLPNVYDYSDGGALSWSLQSGGGAEGDQFIRASGIGGHRIAFPDSRFVARDTSVAISVLLKDSGVNHGWSSGQPVRPINLTVMALSQIGVAFNPALVAGQILFAPANNSGWTLFTGVITGLTVGLTYYLGFLLDGTTGTKFVDIDALMGANGDVPVDFTNRRSIEPTITKLRTTTVQAAGANTAIFAAGGNSVILVAGTGARNEGWATNDILNEPYQLFFRHNGVDSARVGVTTDGNGNIAALHWALDVSGTTATVFAPGNVATGVTWPITKGDQHGITCDGVTTKFWQNGVLRHSTTDTPLPGAAFVARGIFNLGGGNRVYDIFFKTFREQADLNGKLWDGSTGGFRSRVEVLTAAGTAAAIAGQGALATMGAAPWGTHVSGRPTELIDGRIPAILGTNGQLISAGNLPPISGSGARVRFSGVVSFGVTSSTTATINVGAGQLIMGNVIINYNAMSRNVSASSGSTQRYYLYVDPESASVHPYSHGAHTLQASTTGPDIYNSRDRVWIGSVTITFTSGATGTGGSATGVGPKNLTQPATNGDIP